MNNSLIVIQNIESQIAEGTSKDEIIKQICVKESCSKQTARKYYKEAYTGYLEKVKLLPNDLYFKETVEVLDGIREEIKEVKQIAKEQGNLKAYNDSTKNELSALKDRNELLGLTNTGMNISVNFNSVNFGEDEFLESMNENPAQNTNEGSKNEGLQLAPVTNTTLKIEE